MRHMDIDPAWFQAEELKHIHHSIQCAEDMAWDDVSKWESTWQLLVNVKQYHVYFQNPNNHQSNRQNFSGTDKIPSLLITNN